MNIRYRTVIIVTLLYLAGCLSSDPVYRTSHTLVEPSDAHERLLVGQCRQSLQQCEQFAHNNQQSCLAEARRKTSDCVATCTAQRTRNDIARGVHGSEGINRGNCQLSPCGGFDAKCSSIGAQCDGEFKSCFVNAGGNIKTQRYCAYNCDG